MSGCEKIQANRMDLGYQKYRDEYLQKVTDVLDSGWYILGKEVSAFECEFAEYTGVQHCVGLASGLDALWLAFRVLGIGKGDEVIVPANTYIASVMGITINGATPVFIEPNQYYNIDVDKIESLITNHTKAILVVHLYGQAAQMGEIMRIAKKHHLKVVEDCAQAHGAMCHGKMAGTFGDVGCFSFYPSKNLGAFGDAGAVVTNDAYIAKEFRIYRNYGSEKRYYNKVVGANSRLDELQAGLLRIKLAHMDEINRERQELCDKYLKEIQNPRFILPAVDQNVTTVWHQFVLRCQTRDWLIKYLEKNDIGSLIHYPIPPHLSEAYQYLGHKRGDYPITEQYADEVISIPLYQGMGEEQKRVIDVLNSFEG